MNSQRLQGKVALVTGASSGIGEATALALAAEGANICLVARRQDRIAALARKIEGIGREAVYIAADISEAQQAKSAIEQTVTKWSRLDILVNNAGVMFLGPVDRSDMQDWQTMININVLGLMYCTHGAVPIMKAQKSGHIVNISSVAGRVARAGSGGYNASKWAVGAFSEALRQELCADNVRVTVVEPGMTATELTDHIPLTDVREAAKNRAAQITPLRSEDVANAILYAVTQPPHVCINEILLRPTEQQA
ncbi:MAG TPA: SDR family NAD(P)-dependent oxidoreductase [Oculatellaceae cyanobacterium]